MCHSGTRYFYWDKETNRNMNPHGHETNSHTRQLYIYIPDVKHPFNGISVDREAWPGCPSSASHVSSSTSWDMPLDPVSLVVIYTHWPPLAEVLFGFGQLFDTVHLKNDGMSQVFWLTTCALCRSHSLCGDHWDVQAVGQARRLHGRRLRPLAL